VRQDAGVDVEPWHDFAVMIGGASGALTGLLFVAVSLNRDKIVRRPAIEASAGQTLVLLVYPLLISALVLVPEQGRWALAVELLVSAVVATVVLVRIGHRGGDDDRSSLARLVDRRETSLVASLLTAVAAITYWAGGGGGLLWLVPAVLACLISAVLNAWLFLIVEID
jgi:hypothetical protein